MRRDGRKDDEVPEAGRQRARVRVALAWLLCVFCVLHGEADAQKPDGYVSVGVDALPNAPEFPTELRARLFAEKTLTPFSHVKLHLAGSLDLLGFRTFGGDEFPLLPRVDAPGSRRKLTFVPDEVQVEIAAARADLRLGYSRVVWGRLDEVQPTDVVNPLDLARFFFEGRSEARRAVAMARGRFFFGERATVEGILLPQFRRGTFDQLDEAGSPFNLERETVALSAPQPATVMLLRREPAITFGNLQGGGRLSATAGRVDWSASVFRGFDPLGAYVPITSGTLVQVFPRYTMVGGDFETTKGDWALRGEAAHLSGEVDAFDAGVGVDRRAGGYHVSGTVLVHHEAALQANPGSYTATSLVAAADRTFARERYRTRTFGVYNATEGVTFLRNISSMEVRANVTIEGSIGWFFGRGSSDSRRDVIGRLADRDFLYARLRVHF
jgi:hypothetical protein